MKPIRKKYNVAITVALGKAYDSIICDSADTSFKCVKYLKRQRLGFFTFLPLDSVKTRPIKEHLRDLHKNSRLAIDCIEYENEYHRAMQYAFGNTLIIDNMKLAKKLCYGKRERLKAVTVKGTLISLNGNITGGSDSSGVSSRAKLWDDKEVQNIKAKRDELLDEMRELENDLEGVSEADLQTMVDSKQHQLNIHENGKP
eukprot:UN24531